jgi:citrate lyase subunit beta / citryl-CoA lyase
MSAPRSYLFVPGDRPERFDKALAAGADAVIVDLEDAVAPERKGIARDAVAAWLSTTHRALVRINAADTPWFADDLALCAHAGIAAVMLPKAERPDDLLAVTRAMGANAAGHPGLLPLVETAIGFDQIKRLATTLGVQRLVFGSIDFQADLGMRGGREELLAFRSQLVLASRLANLAPPVDGVTTALDDPRELEDDTLHARRLGFGAKLCIHPRQVAAVNAGFSPSAAEVAWAERVIAAFEAAKGAAVAVDGKMVDKPVVLRAEAILRDTRRGRVS